MMALVDMIGENCEVLPNIECLPITQGELDQVEVADAQRYRNEVGIEHRLLVQDVARTESALYNDPDNEKLQEDLYTFQNALANMDDRLTDADQELEKILAAAEAAEEAWREGERFQDRGKKGNEIHQNQDSRQGAW